MLRGVYPEPFLGRAEGLAMTLGRIEYPARKVTGDELGYQPEKLEKATVLPTRLWRGLVG